MQLAAREGYRSVEHLKRYTTTGMGTDQGKTSNVNALAILSDVLASDIPTVGTTTFRPPYTPATIGAYTGRNVGKLFEPVRKTRIDEWARANGAKFEHVGQWMRAWYFPKAGETFSRPSTARPGPYGKRRYPRRLDFGQDRYPGSGCR